MRSCRYVAEEQHNNGNYFLGELSLKANNE